MLVELAVVAVAGAVGLAVLKRPRPVPAEPDVPRVQKLVAMRDEIARAIQARDVAHLMGEQLVQVDAMVTSFRQLLEEERRLGAYLRANPQGLIDREIRELEAKADRAHGAKRDVLRENVGILEQRRDKQLEIFKSHDTLKTRLDMLEDTVKLVLDQALTASSPAELAVDFQRLTRTIAATDEAIAETRALLPERQNTP
jgi:hypothetical protein